MKKLRKKAYDIAVDAWYILAGLIPVWAPILGAMATGVILRVLKW